MAADSDTFARREEFLKRTIDVIGSLAGLMLLSPLLLAVAVLVRWRDGGPALFRQERIGRHGRPFWLLKFRTMVVDAASRGGELTVGADSRITPLGTWLRKWKLDELPQLVNVLRGEMSLVGPRPEVGRYVQRYSAAEARVLELLPGITDPASIRYRNESELLATLANPEQAYLDTVMPDKIRLNLAYAATATVWTDLLTILRTVAVILPRQEQRKTPGSVQVRQAQPQASISRKTICFLSAEHPPLDKRVFEKEAVSLAAAGYRVIHLCPAKTRQDEAKKLETVRDVEIITYRREPGRLKRLTSLPGLFSLARALQADVHHCNEPDSWLVGVVLRLVDGTPVVFDCHEHYPGQVVRWLPWGLRRMGAWLTRCGLQTLGLMTDLVVLAKHSVANDLSWSRRRHLVVLNTTPLTAMNLGSAHDPSTIAARNAHPFTFVHTGVIRRERGSEQLLAAMAELSRRGVRSYRLRIIGEFKDGSRQDFLARAAALRILDQIEIYDWLPFAEACALVQQSHAGLVLFQKSLSNNVLGMPHKMFDYMLAGLPVIAPNFAPDIKSVLGPARAGLLIDPSNPRELADAMQQLIEQPELTRRLGAAGRAAAQGRYYWEFDAANLVAAYRRLLENVKPLPDSTEARPLARAA